MKKLIAMLMTAMCSVSISLAQETVTGVVVDKKGNPLPGVRIEVPGTSDQAISDLDGSFTLFRSDPSKKKVYATYAGMNPRKVKIKDGMRIKMKEYNWWTQKPDEWNWMVNAIFAVPNYAAREMFDPAYGLMIGRMKNYGFYVKGITNTFSRNIDERDSSMIGFIDKQKSTYWSATGGIIARLGCPIHLYAGVGYAEYSHLIRGVNGDWHKFSEASYDNFVIDCGFILRIKRVDISLGWCFAPRNEVYRKYNWLNDEHRPMGSGNFGIGYLF